MWNQKKGKKTKRFFFLFNDIMLLAKKKGQKSGKFLLRVHITLRSPFVEVEDVKTVSTHHEFRIHCRTRSFILYTDTREQKESWMQDIINSVKGEHPEELKAKGVTKKVESEPKRSNTDDEVGIKTKERRVSRTQPDLASPRTKKTYGQSRGS